MFMSDCNNVPSTHHLHPAHIKSGVFQARRNYTASQDGELSLAIGDILSSVKELGNDWCLGRNESSPDPRVGIFPYSCIVPLTPTRNCSAGAKTGFKTPISNEGIFSMPKSLDDIKRESKTANSRSKSKEGTVPHCRDQPVSLRFAVRPREQEVSSELTSQDVHYSSLPSPKHGRSIAVHKPHLIVKPNQDKAAGMAAPGNQGSEGGGGYGNEPEEERHVLDFNMLRNENGMNSIDASPVIMGQSATMPCPSCILYRNGVDQPRMYSTEPRAAHFRSFSPLQELPECADEDYPRHARECRIYEQNYPIELDCMKDSSANHSRDYAEQSFTMKHAVDPRYFETKQELLEQRSAGAASQRSATMEPSVSRRDHCPCHRKFQTMSPSSASPSNHVCCSGTGHTQTLKHRQALQMRKQRVADGCGAQRSPGAPRSPGAQNSPSADNIGGRLCRFTASFVCSICLGLFALLWMVLHLGYSFTTAVLVSAVVALVLCALLVASRLARCVAALVVPSLATARGHAVFAVLLCGYLLTGPVSNVFVNMEEVSRAMSCSAEQSYNQTLVLLRPFDEMMLHLNRTIVGLQAAAHDVTDRLRPIEEGLGGVELDVHQGRTQLLGTKKTCQALIERAYDACAAGMHRAQHQCLGVMGALGNVYHHARDVLDRINPNRWAPKQTLLLRKRQALPTDQTGTPDELSLSRDNNNICHPLNTSQVCHTLNDSASLCQPSQWAGEAIQEAINATQAAVRSLHGALRFYVSTEPYSAARRNATAAVLNIRRGVREEFARRTESFRLVVTVLTRLIPLTLLLLLHVAYLHVKYYMCRDAYDNFYVGRRVAEADLKRAEVTGERVLPLRQYERRFLVDCGSAELSESECGMYRGRLCVIALSLLIALTCYMFDYVLYWVLAVLERQGEQEGVDVTAWNSTELNVTGEGIIVELLQIFLQGFHPGRGLDPTFLANAPTCLPSPSAPSLLNLFVTSLFYVVFVLVVLLQAYVFRLRNSVAGYFYMERDRVRGLYLYRVLLMQRQRQPALLHAVVRTNLHRLQLGALVGAWRPLAARCRGSAARGLCLVCLRDVTLTRCETELCRGAYCEPCYVDLLRVCPLCVYLAADVNLEEMDEEEGEEGLEVYRASTKLDL